MGHSIESQELSSIDLNALAQKITARGLTVPAVFLLELYKPLAGLFHHFGLAAHPMLTLFLGKQSSDQLLSLISTQSSLEALICAIEKNAEESK